MLAANLLFPSVFLVSTVAALSPLVHELQLPRAHIPYADDPDDNVAISSFHSSQNLPPYKTIYYFDQLIDHHKPELGTFKQRYWHNYEFYKPGGPIVLGTPGEVSADGFSAYLTNTTINGVIAQALDGATVLLEHRFFGKSNPYPDLSVKSLQVHTIEQAIEDLDYFARNVHLPMPGGDQVAPGKAPWIMIGGSYPGALVSWAMRAKPDLFWAGYSTAGVVQALGHFWRYYDPIKEYLPKNCSTDVQAVIAHVDATFDSRDAVKIKEMKAIFGLEDIVHNDDFADALRIIFYYWQQGSIISRANSIYEFCDALEVDNGKVAPATGWGLEHALEAWGNFWKKTFYRRMCGTRNAEACFGSYNERDPSWNNVAIPNDQRSWKWMTCNEVGWFPVGPPHGYSSIVSRYMTPQHAERGCRYDFPGAFTGKKRKSILNALNVNLEYGGWNVTTERLIFVNGDRDPWREVTVATHGAAFTPNEMQPHLLTDGFHCSDMRLSESRASKSITAAQDKALEYLKKWHKDWHPTA